MLKTSSNIWSIKSIMEVTSFTLLFLAFIHIVTAEAPLYQIAQKLKIPDSIEITSYTKTIRVELNGAVVKPGDPVPAKNFKNLEFQKITWEPDDYDAKYTLILLDIDRKTGPNQNGSSTGFYNQFTSVNIPGSSILNGQSVVAFDPPNVPCQPSTKHRLVLLALLQKQNIDLGELIYLSSAAGPSPKRENFKLDELMKKYQLELGAANVFSALGESNGICSGTSTIHSLQNNVSFALVAMVMLASSLAMGGTMRHRRLAF